MARDFTILRPLDTHHTPYYRSTTASTPHSTAPAGHRLLLFPPPRSRAYARLQLSCYHHTLLLSYCSSSRYTSPIMSSDPDPLTHVQHWEARPVRARCEHARRLRLRQPARRCPVRLQHAAAWRSSPVLHQIPVPPTRVRQRQRRQRHTQPLQVGARAIHWSKACLRP